MKIVTEKVTIKKGVKCVTFVTFVTFYALSFINP